MKYLAAIDTSHWPAKFFVWAIGIFAFGLLTYPLGDPDVYVHLRDGRHWVESALQVGNDPFTYTASDKPFDQIEPLFRIGIYELWRVGGYNLLILTKALLMTLTFLSLGLLMLRRWHSLEVVGGLGIAFILIPLACKDPLTRGFQERPYIFTYLFAIGSLLLIESQRGEGFLPNAARYGRRLWWLVLLIIPWANLHPGFMVLFVFLGAYGLELLIQFARTPETPLGRALLTLSAVSLVAFLAGALNPMGFGLYHYVLHHLGTSAFMKIILEWAPPTFENAPFFFISLGLCWAVALACLRKSRLADLLCLGFFSYSACRSYRNIPFFYLVAMPILTGNLYSLYRRYYKRSWSADARLSLALKNRVYLGTGLGLLVVLSTLTVSGYAFRLGEIPEMYPSESLAWLEKHPIEGRIFAHDLWGGYIGWNTHGKIKIFLDGRIELFGIDTFRDYTHLVYGNEDDFSFLLKRYDIQAILMKQDNDIHFFEQLRRSGDWALIYWDDVALLYARRRGPNRALIAQYEYHVVDPKEGIDLQNADLKVALAETRRAAEAAPRSYKPRFLEADLLMQMGQLPEAREAVAKTAGIGPEYAIETKLGTIAMLEKHYPEAADHFRRAIKLCPSENLRFRGTDSFLLAQTLRNIPGQEGEAYAWATKAVRELGGFSPAVSLLNDLKEKK